MAPLASTTEERNDSLHYDTMKDQSRCLTASGHPIPQYDRGQGATATITDATRLSSPAKNRSRLVNFGTVEIREYDVAIGACSVPSQGGVPIGIAYEYVCLPTQQIEEYELDRLPNRRYKIGNGNPLEVLRIPADERFGQLLSIGISVKKIQKASRECEKINLTRESNTSTVQDERGEEAEDDQFLLACLLKDDAIAKNKSTKNVSRNQGKSQWWRKARHMNRFFRR